MQLDLDDLERCAQRAGIWRVAMLLLIAEVRRLRPLAGTPGVTLFPAAVDGSPCTNLGVWNGSGVDPVQAEGDGFT